MNPKTEKKTAPNLLEKEPIHGPRDAAWSQDIRVMYPHINLKNLKLGTPPKKIVAKLRQQHAGPGAHPGTGSPQEVHGGGAHKALKGKFKGKPANPEGIDTKSMYQHPDGTWTKERQAKHEEILAKFRGNATPVEKPVSYVMGGGTASGKSSSIKSGQVEIPENAIWADSDKIKGELPEFEGPNAWQVHEESSYLVKKLAYSSAADKYNVVLDGTGDSSYASLERKVNGLRAAGQEVHGVYVSIPTEKAIARNQKRADDLLAAGKKPRIVNEAVVRAIHAGVSRIVPEALDKGLYDTFRLYSNDVPKNTPPILMVSAEGKKVTIHEPELYEEFLAKAKEGY